MTAASLTDINPYESPRQPMPMAATPRVFTSANRMLGVALLVVPVVVLAVGGPALAVAAWVASTGRSGLECWFVAIASVLVVVPTIVLCAQFAAGWSNRWMLNKLARLWKERGIDVDQLGGRFMELATADQPRLYYGSSTNWDIGFVILSADLLVYLGDQISFALSRDQIVRLRVGHGSYERFHPDCLFVTWTSISDESSQTLCLGPGEGWTLTAMQKSLPSIVRSLENWLHGRANQSVMVPPSCLELPPPRLAEVPSKSAWPQIVVLMVLSAIAGTLGAGLALSSALSAFTDLHEMPPALSAALGGAALAACAIGLVVIAPHTFRELLAARAAKSP